MNGQSPPDSDNVTLEITEDQITPKMPNRDEKPAKYTLDPSKSPKHIDLMVDNRTMQGIYELKDDTLRLCFSRNGPRPSSFDGNGDGMMLIEAKKEKK